jgi:hypothetical protein
VSLAGDFAKVPVTENADGPSLSVAIRYSVSAKNAVLPAWVRRRMAGQRNRRPA